MIGRPGFWTTVHRDQNRIVLQAHQRTVGLVRDEGRFQYARFLFPRLPCIKRSNEIDPGGELWKFFVIAAFWRTRIRKE